MAYSSLISFIIQIPISDRKWFIQTNPLKNSCRFYFESFCKNEKRMLHQNFLRIHSFKRWILAQISISTYVIMPSWVICQPAFSNCKIGAKKEAAPFLFWQILPFTKNFWKLSMIKHVLGIVVTKSNFLRRHIFYR